jgi:aspartate carbamoyltransferase regulatory subunit
MSVKQIEFITNGTVIDHIKAGEALHVLDVLHLTEDIRSGQCKVMVGCNFESGNLGFKDIIKISNRVLTEKELNQISLLAPNATVNIIENEKVVKKFFLKSEAEIHNIIRCANPSCITNNEPMGTLFRVLDADQNSFECHYCGVTLKKDKLHFK